MGIFDRVKKCWNKLTGGVTAPTPAEIDAATTPPKDEAIHDPWHLRLMPTADDAKRVCGIARGVVDQAFNVTADTIKVIPAKAELTMDGYPLPPLLPNGTSLVQLCEDGSVHCNGKVYDGEGQAHDVVAEPPKAERTTNASRRIAQEVQDRQRSNSGGTRLNRAQRRALASLGKRK